MLTSAMCILTRVIIFCLILITWMMLFCVDDNHELKRAMGNRKDIFAANHYFTEYERDYSFS